jgi:hypothetical protein
MIFIYHILPVQMVERLKIIAKNEMCNDNDDNFAPDDIFGGNFNDCYWGAREDGRTALARVILESIGVEW